MSAMLPYRPTHLMVVGLILVDLPVLVAVLIAGFWFGFAHTYWAVTGWRLDHPWSLLPSLLLLAVLVRRCRRSRP